LQPLERINQTGENSIEEVGGRDAGNELVNSGTCGNKLAGYTESCCSEASKV